MLKVYHSIGHQESRFLYSDFTGRYTTRSPFSRFNGQLEGMRGLLVFLWTNFYWTIFILGDCIRPSVHPAILHPGNEFQIKSSLSEENHGSR
jgi:hypothetical protein